jgi:hypothetical protein
MLHRKDSLQTADGGITCGYAGYHSREYPFYYPPVAAGKKHNLGTIFVISGEYFGTMDLFNNQVCLSVGQNSACKLFLSGCCSKTEVGGDPESMMGS